VTNVTKALSMYGHKRLAAQTSPDISKWVGQYLVSASVNGFDMKCNGTSRDFE